MNEYKRAKLNKILIIVAIVLIVISIISIISYGVFRRKIDNEKLNYNDTVIGKNYFFVHYLNYALYKYYL